MSTWVLLWSGLIVGTLVLWSILIARVARKARALNAEVRRLMAALEDGEALHSPQR